MTDRHPKWVRVEPGTVIPAGQPHRVTYIEKYDEEAGPACGHDDGWEVDDVDDVWEVDASWKPPLVLPTEPTWGIAVHKQGYSGAAEWFVAGPDDGPFLRCAYTSWSIGLILDFIPLTDEQVARIEAAR